MSHEQRVRDYWDRLWSAGDLAYAGEFYAPRYLHNGVERTPEQLAAAAAEFRTYFDGFRAEVVRLLDAGDVVVSRVVFRGVHRRDWPGVPAVGARVEVSGLDVFRFGDGLVVEHLHEADHEAMWEQLGIALPPG